MEELKEYQRQACRAAGDKPAFGFVMDRGTGKTPTYLKNSEELIQRGLVRRALVTAPLSTLEQISKACFRFCSTLRPTLIWGTKQKRVQLIQTPKGNIDIINFEACRTVQDDLLAAGYDMVVVDESIRIADMDTQVSKVVKALGKRAKYRRIAAGAPFTEGLEDAWNQFDFLEPGIFGQSGFWGFRNRYCTLEQKEIPDRDKTGRIIWIEEGLACTTCAARAEARGLCEFCGCPIGPRRVPKMRKYQTITGYKNVEEFEAKIAPYIFRAAKKDVLPELPDKSFETISVPMVEEQKKLYRQIRDKQYSELSDGTEINHANALAKGQKLREVASGFVYGDDRKPVFVPSGKYERLGEILDDGIYGDRKVVIFTAFRPEPALVKETVSRCRKKIGVYCLPEKKELRSSTIEAWERHVGPAVFIGNVASTGVGLNLQKADWAIFFGLPWSQDQYSQAIDRIHRIGSEVFQKVFITHLISEGTIEEKMLKALTEKTDLVNMVLEDLRQWQKERDEWISA